MINQLQGIWIICSVVLQMHVMLLEAWKKHTWYIINTMGDLCLDI